MTFYVILSAADQPHSEGREVDAGSLQHVVESLAGRSCTPWLHGNLRRSGRCYVATAAGSPGRETYGRGFHVHVR